MRTFRDAEKNVILALLKHGASVQGEPFPFLEMFRNLGLDGHFQPDAEWMEAKWHDFIQGFPVLPSQQANSARGGRQEVLDAVTRIARPLAAPDTVVPVRRSSK